MRGLLAVLWLAAVAPAAAQDAPRVTATPSKDEVTVGETFYVEVRAEGPSGTTWTFPAEAGNDDVELRAAPETAAAAAPGPAPAESAPDRLRYAAAVYTLTDAAVPPIAVKYRLADGTEGSAETAPLPLRTTSLLPKDPQQQALADIRGPLPLGIGRAFWIALAVGALLLAAAIFWLVRRRRARRRPAAPVVLELAPDVEARQALDRLEAAGWIARGEQRPFYIALSEIAKRYLERRLAAPVLEMTTSEMLALLRDHAHGQHFIPPLRDVSAAADHVKFARGAGLAEEARRHLGAVRAVVDGLEERLRPAADPRERVA